MTTSKRKSEDEKNAQTTEASAKKCGSQNAAVQRETILTDDTQNVTGHKARRTRKKAEDEAGRIELEASNTTPRASFPEGTLKEVSRSSPPDLAVSGETETAPKKRATRKKKSEPEASSVEKAASRIESVVPPRRSAKKKKASNEPSEPCFEVPREVQTTAKAGSDIGTGIMDASDVEDARCLRDCFRCIQDIALTIHEQLELRGTPIMRLFEQFIFGAFRRVSDDALCTAVWNCALFTRARLVEQQKFQDRVLAALPDAEHTLIMRQLLCTPPRAWSYRRSYQRCFAHTLNGPQKTTEISLHASMSASGLIHDDAHIYALGWMVTFHDKNWLITACEMTRDQAFSVEALHPYPLHRRDELFWEEMFCDVMRSMYQTESVLSVENSRRALFEQTDYQPEEFFLRFQKLVVRQMYATHSSDLLRAAADIHDVIALRDAKDVHASIERAVMEFTSSRQADYRDRLLEAFGCDASGNVPQAAPAVLANDPTALLLLDSELPLFKQVHPRDPIKAALQYESQNGEDRSVHRAFDQYVAEKRWLQTFASFDLNDEAHASIVGLPIDSIKNVFDPKLFDARLSIAPQAEYQHQLQEKFGYYMPDAPLPRFREVLEALMSRRIQRGNAMAPLVQWLFQCCERWRNCLSEVETATLSPSRTLDQNSARLLSNGLRGLAAMFRKS